MQIAEHMWDDFVVKLKGTSGPLFCDSCHDGKHDFLTRSDKPAVTALMNTYVSKLTKKGGDSASCQTCHGDDFEMKIFEKLWKIKR